ncbi:MAG TPA: tetratricopeptide repeat protein [Planctomycetota bacterium]|nr:tetratricopeptide repeat protein [Planctomycetota bacterium]
MGDWLEFPRDSGESRSDGWRRHPAEELMLSGERLYFEGEFQDAAREFRGARKHDPAFFDAWAAEVDARLRAGDVPRAAETADEALGSYGRVPVFYAAKALVLAHQGYIEAACEHSDIAVKHRGNALFTWLARAEVVLATGAWGTLESTNACFEKACQADPSHWRANFRAALCLIQWGRHERALERLAHVTQFVPQNPFVWKTMGDCHRALGNPCAARECYRMALARRPDYAPATEALEEMTLWGRFRKWVAGLGKRKRRAASREPRA